MEIKDFIGKVLIESKSKKRYVLKEITAPYIAVKEEENANSGISIIYDTINGDPFERGVLRFEDAAQNALFRAVYDAYCHTKDAYYEQMEFWMRRG